MVISAFIDYDNIQIMVIASTALHQNAPHDVCLFVALWFTNNRGQDRNVHPAAQNATSDHLGA